MKKVLVLVSVVAAFLATSSTAFAHKGKHKRPGKKPAMQRSAVIKMGTIIMHEQKERNVLKFNKCKTSKNRGITALKLRVKGETVEVDKLKVVFQNGTKQVLNVKDQFRPSQSSRWIDLKGQKRCIKKIILAGDVDTFGYTPFAKAKVEFFGLTK
jgi:hypothetical protein